MNLKTNIPDDTNFNSPSGAGGSFNPPLGVGGISFRVGGGLHLVIFLACLLFAACSGTRHLPAGEKLYTGAKVKIEATEKVSKGFYKAIAENAIRPKPNSSYFGMRPQLCLYMMAGENPKSKFKKWLQKTGEAPVLLSAVKPGATSAIIDAKLFNQGIFRSYTQFDIVEKKHTAKIIYTSYIHKPYIVKNLVYAISDDSISKLIIRDKENTLLKSGEEYSLETLKNERERIDALLKTQGYFYFNPDYLIFKADTTAVNDSINFKLTIK